MEDFINALYGYAQEIQVPRYLANTEYRQAMEKLVSEWDEFCASLTKEQNQQLDALMTKKGVIGLMEEQAAFCSALSIGISLGRL